MFSARMDHTICDFCAARAGFAAASLRETRRNFLIRFIRQKAVGDDLGVFAVSTRFGGGLSP